MQQQGQVMQNTEAVAVPHERRRWRVREIIRAVAWAFEVNAKAMAGPSRAAALVHARQAVMWMARGEGCWSLTHIGQALGNRDHTTVIHGAKAAAKRMAADEGYRLLVQDAIGALERGDIMTLEETARHVVTVPPLWTKPEPEPEPEPVVDPPRHSPETQPAPPNIDAMIRKGMPQQFTPEWWRFNAVIAQDGFTRGYAAEAVARLKDECATKKPLREPHTAKEAIASACSGQL